MSFRGSIIIVNFNSANHLRDCLESVSACAPGARVIVVDNASSDGSDRAAESTSSVSLRRNSRNLGFARAVNQGLEGLAAVSDDLVLMLNPDCRLTPDALALLSGELARHAECAVVGPQILNEDGSIQGSARGDPTALTGLFGRTTLLTRLFPHSPIARRNVRTAALPPDGDSMEVDWVSGACMLARRSMLDEVGGFDERYFLYWEDADLCRRLRARGRTIRYQPAAVAMHAAGQSSRTVPALAARAFHDSAYTYYATHVARSVGTRAAARVLLWGRYCWKRTFARAVNQNSGDRRPAV